MIILMEKDRFFVPIHNWLSNDLKSMAIEKLYSKEMSKYFSKQYLDKAFKGFKGSPLYYSRQLWSLLSFAMWHEQFIEQKKLK